AMMLLVGPFGLKGAAFSLVLAEAAGVVVGYLLSRQAHPLPFAWRPIVKVVAAVVVMAVPTALIEWSDAEDSILGLAMSIVTGVGFYA
ncbi:polysaccharide biosynthesis C-terminal domain-containing protein, partial [Stenotrophomonas maltophilia]|uniref:polysaccharide biosynthesis C-terminal domain-containing protein n=1 Tax=Stenotrophomonas maltophilia TaxID=40324 RepID=UPI001954D28F